MNYVFLGAGAYGFEAGSRTYFGKSVKDVNLEEAALLAAIPKSPEYSPTRNMEKAKMRRDIVLDQMAKYFPQKYSQAEVDVAKAKPITLAGTAYYQSQQSPQRGIIRWKRSANIWRKVHHRWHGRPQGVFHY